MRGSVLLGILLAGCASTADPARPPAAAERCAALISPSDAIPVSDEVLEGPQPYGQKVIRAAFDGEGVWFAWGSQRGGSDSVNAVSVRRMACDGTWTTPVTAFETRGARSQPDLAVGAEGVLVVWTEPDQGATWGGRIRTAMVDPEGRPIADAALPPHPDGGLVDESYLRVAPLPDGGFALAYVVRQQTWLLMLDAAGVPEGEASLATSDGYTVTAMIARDQGRLAIAQERREPMGSYEDVWVRVVQGGTFGKAVTDGPVWGEGADLSEGSLGMWYAWSNGNGATSAWLVGPRTAPIEVTAARVYSTALAVGERYVAVATANGWGEEAEVAVSWFDVDGAFVGAQEFPDHGSSLGLVHVGDDAMLLSGRWDDTVHARFVLPP